MAIRQSDTPTLLCIPPPAFVYRSRGPGFQYTFRPQYRAHHHHHHHHNHNVWLCVLALFSGLCTLVTCSLVFLPQAMNVWRSRKVSNVYTCCNNTVTLKHYLLRSHRPLERGFMFVKCYPFLCCCWPPCSPVCCLPPSTPPSLSL